MINVEQVRRQVANILIEEGFDHPDADRAEFRSPDNLTRFKVGTVYGEVTITAWQGAVCIATIRLITPRSLDEGLRDLARLIESGWRG